jgi:hypothetical protein
LPYLSTNLCERKEMSSDRYIFSKQILEDLLDEDFGYFENRS